MISVIFLKIPSLYLMFVVLVRVISFLHWLCIIFLAFYLATCSVLYLSLSFRLEVVCNGMVCILLCGRLTFLRVTLGVSFASKSLLLLHISTPLPVHRIRMLADLKEGSIAEEFCLSITRIECLSSQSWILRECMNVTWWSRSFSVRSRVMGIGLSSTSVCVIDISKYLRSSLRHS